MAPGGRGPAALDSGGRLTDTQNWSAGPLSFRGGASDVSVEHRRATHVAEVVIRKEDLFRVNSVQRRFQPTDNSPAD